MKKIKALAIIPLFAIASCSQNTEIKNQEVTPKEVAPISNSSSETNSSGTITMSGENLNENISSNSIVENKPFDEKYNLPNGMEVSLKGSLEVTGGKITNVSFENPQGTQIKFAEGVPSKIVGKDLKGLKVDYVSGASLCTEAFNNFIDKIN